MLFEEDIMQSALIINMLKIYRKIDMGKLRAIVAFVEWLPY